MSQLVMTGNFSDQPQRALDFSLATMSSCKLMGPGMYTKGTRKVTRWWKDISERVR